MAKKEHISYDKFSAKQEKVIVVEVPDAEKADVEEILKNAEVYIEDTGAAGEPGPKGPIGDKGPEGPIGYKGPRMGFPNCPALNVRKWPSIVAGVVCVIDNTVELIEDASYEDEEWSKIYTVDGIEGYCMKKFIDFK